MLKFVVQHHTTLRSKGRTHADFRIEQNNKLISWAVPKLIATDGTKRLAIQTEDHAMSWMNFQGEIPAGQYGAGTVEIYDKGTYILLEKSKDKYVINLKGKKLKGIYNLIRLENKKWLIFKGRSQKMENIIAQEILAAVQPQKLSLVKETAKTTIIKRAQQGFRIIVGSKTIWPGLGNKTGLYDFKYDIMSKLWKSKGEKFQNDLDRLLKTRTKVKILDYKNIDNKKAIWEPVMEITIKPSRK